MNKFLSPFWAKPDLNIYIVLSSVFIHVLGLASAVFVMLVYSRYLSHGLDSTLYTLTSGVLLALLIEVLLRRARFNIISSLCVTEARKLSERVRSKLLNAQSAALQVSLAKETEGTPVWIEKISQALSPAVVMALLDMPFAILFVIVLFMLSWQLGLATLVVVSVLLVILAWGGLRMKSLSVEQQQNQGMLHSLLKTTELTEAVRTNNAQAWLSTRLTEQAGTGRLAKSKVQVQQEKMQSYTRTVTMLLSVIVIAIGAQLALAGDMDFGMLIGANIIAGRLVALISQPVNQLPIWLNALQAQNKLSDFETMPEDNHGGTQLANYSGRIAFKHVAFSYHQSPLPVYEHLNLELDAGEMLMVVGSNGKGKTTLARLIAGLMVPQRGSILVDGVDLRQVDAHWWRQQLVYLPQEPDFLPGTLRENLLFLQPEADDIALMDALKKVGLGVWVEQHPEGLDMVIQMRGRNLATGIRRRMALARALLSQGRLIVIDEPLEGLDQAGITMMQNLITELSLQKRTLIVISQFLQQAGPGTKVLNLDGKHDMQIVQAKPINDQVASG
ncbi:MAG: ATP-binding cassette domain-containing protein [Methylococcaceae bacterium]|nr:ATP-binding cassette domain-containing protein [Methylococcaceae bacterium]